MAEKNSVKPEESKPRKPHSPAINPAGLMLNTGMDADGRERVDETDAFTPPVIP